MVNLGGAVPILPVEYQQVEYLQSSGSQYIKLNYTTNGQSIINFNVDFELLSVGSVFGAYSVSGNCGTLHNNNSSINFYYKSLTVNTLGALNNRYRYIIGINSNNILIKKYDYLSGTTSNYNGTATGTCPALKPFMFGQSKNGNIANCSSLKLYHFYIDFGEDPVCELYPCYRKSDNKPGLFDIVTNTFFTNAGTGEFTFGPNV